MRVAYTYRNAVPFTLWRQRKRENGKIPDHCGIFLFSLIISEFSLILLYSAVFRWDQS